MKNLILIITLFIPTLFSNKLNAQEKSGLTYTLFYNQVNKDCNYPLIGFVNLAKSNHTGLELGFINTTLKNQQGAQIGFINTTTQELKGTQIGFINTAIETRGAQIGFLNTSPTKIDGAQIGFVNYTNETKGSQISFLNKTKTLKGSQIGFINIVDTVENGMPVGFITIAKKGGYHSFELSSNETYPVNLSYKIGLKKLYTFIQGSYNKNHKNEYGLGAGFGTLIQLNSKLFMTPEAYTISSVGKNNYHGVSISNTLRYAPTKQIHIAVGPSLMWMRNLDSENNKTSFLGFVDKTYNDKNWLIFGLKTALSFELK